MKVSIPKATERASIKDPATLAGIFKAILASEPVHDREKEHFWIVGLNTRNNMKYIDLVSLGTLNASLVHPREVFRFAIMQGTCSLVIVHNHPSNDPEPSDDDLHLTQRLREVGNLIGIEVLDHVIIGNDSSTWTSFKTRGLMS